MYRIRWRRTRLRIHLWLGIAIRFVIAIVCLSGRVLVYRNELEVELNRDLYSRTPMVARAQGEPEVQPDAMLHNSIGK